MKYSIDAFQGLCEVSSGEIVNLDELKSGVHGRDEDAILSSSSSSRDEKEMRNTTWKSRICAHPRTRYPRSRSCWLACPAMKAVTPVTCVVEHSFLERNYELKDLGMRTKINFPDI